MPIIIIKQWKNLTRWWMPQIHCLDKTTLNEHNKINLLLIEWYSFSWHFYSIPDMFFLLYDYLPSYRPQTAVILSFLFFFFVGYSWSLRGDDCFSVWNYVPSQELSIIITWANRNDGYIYCLQKFLLHCILTHWKCCVSLSWMCRFSLPTEMQNIFC